MSTKKIKLELLKKYIKELIKQELEEASMTGNLDGGEGPPKTPYAFTGKRKKDKKKKDDIVKAAGFQKVSEARFALDIKDEAGVKLTVIVDAGSEGAAKMKVARKLKGGSKSISNVRRVQTGKAKQIDKKLENVNEVTNKEITALSNLIKGFDKIQRDYFNIKKLGDKELKDKKYDKVYYKAILDCKEKIKDLLDIFYRKNAALESVNEGRYHDYRNDESLTPKQKIGRSMMEVRDKLNELDKLIKMNVRLKNEVGVDSTSYWKRTHGAMKKISERLVKLANKIGQLY